MKGLIGVLLHLTIMPQAVPTPVQVSEVIEDAYAGTRIGVVLLAWRDANPGVVNAQFGYRQYEYDEVFKKETRKVGSYRSPNPSTILIKWAPAEIEGVQSGKPGYQLEAGKSGLLFIEGNTVSISHNVDEKTYDRIEIPFAYINKSAYAWGLQEPKQVQGFCKQLGMRLMVGVSGYGYAKMVQTLVCGNDLAEFQDQFRWQVDEDTEEKLYLIGYPKHQEARRMLRSLQVALNPETHQVTAIKINDPSGNKSTVMIFSTIKVNTICWAFWSKPSFRNWKQISNYGPTISILPKIKQPSLLYFPLMP